MHAVLMTPMSDLDCMWKYWTTYWQRANNVISKTVGEISSKHQCQPTANADCAQTVYDRVLWCENMYLEFKLEGIVLELLNKSVGDSLRVYRELNGRVALLYVAWYADKLCMLNGTQPSTLTTCMDKRPRIGGRVSKRLQWSLWRQPVRPEDPIETGPQATVSRTVESLMTLPGMVELASHVSIWWTNAPFWKITWRL